MGFESKVSGCSLGITVKGSHLWLPVTKRLLVVFRIVRVAVTYSFLVAEQ